MSGHDNAELDARLDEAFRGLADTDELRDLRDELRASLAARVAELEAAGSGPAAAVATAFAEVGDVREIAAEVAGVAPASPTSPASPSSPGRRAAELVARHRVRPRPAFVVRTVVLALLAAAGLTLTVLTVFGILTPPLAVALLVAVALVAAPLGVIAGDAVHQETTAHYPVPAGRAAGYGASTFLGLSGLGLSALFLTDTAQVWLLAVGAPLLVAGIAWLSFLAATQTNRTKPWMRELQSRAQGADRFSQDEAAAARFGIYTVVVFVIAIAAFIVLSFTVGFAWSWLALVAGVAVFFVILARMLFPSGSTNANGQDHD